ncbi:hypothetical protein Mapa_009819 [Marchantia paleacea]|nr:hypothetical protein Mapa_009819 [Marchantia paleacea]
MHIYWLGEVSSSMVNPLWIHVEKELLTQNYTAVPKKKPFRRTAQKFDCKSVEQR